MYFSALLANRWKLNLNKIFPNAFQIEFEAIQQNALTSRLGIFQCQATGAEILLLNAPKTD